MDAAAQADPALAKLMEVFPGRIISIEADAADEDPEEEAAPPEVDSEDLEE